METTLEGRVVLVTGASRGIGEATVRHLAGMGARVVLAARDEEAISRIAAELNGQAGTALAVPTDVTDCAALDLLCGQVKDVYGRLDGLVNSAGVLPEARRLERLSVDEWQAIHDLNLRAPWYLSCRAKELMTSGGVIVNLASVATYFPSVGLGAYCVSKAGLAMLTRACALEWARNGIRVVGVVPGKVDTAMVRPILEYSEKHNLSLNLLERVARPEEVAELIGYLISDRAAFITGAMIPIDGGELVGTAG